MDKNDNKKTPKNAQKFSCESCYFTCSKKSDWNRHILTLKHTMVKNVNEMVTKNTPFAFNCNCGKKYLHASGLSRHQKKCNQNNIIENNVQSSDQTNTSLILELLKQNQEFKTLIIDLLGNKGLPTNITNRNNNITNNKFNLNFFLNEQCKDAMNIMDFVNSLQLQLADLEKVGELGYAQGISDIFINGLKELDVFKRPIHCSDIKREIMYIKDKDAWEKENNKRDKLNLAIKHIAHKNAKQISEWQKENPDCKDGQSNVHEQFLKIVCESMGGHNEEEDTKNYNKIIRNVAKEVTIDR